MTIFDSARLTVKAFAFFAVSSSVCAAPALHAQSMVSQPVVQALPSAQVQRLNRALLELARRPQSLPALLEAGDASIEVGDLDAALGFFGRAREIDADNAQVMLGLGKVYLRSGRPTTALPLFHAAEAAGAGLYNFGSDKALALDMVGDQSAAQTAYARVLELDAQDNEARRRLALSYAISGNGAAFETTLRPLIERRDPASFRARAFGLAILGQQERAATITETVMPRTLSAKITPYLEFMPRLTPAQQAAAANLGIFPRAADIGRDNADIVAYRAGPKGGVETVIATAQPKAQDVRSRLEPAGEPLGQPSAPTPIPKAAPQRVADVFGDILARDENAAQPAAGAVDIAAIEIPREAPPKAEPKEPIHPSRIWVQLATGRDLKALGFDWRRFARKAPDQLKPYQPYKVRWGQANRLLVGPLKSRKQASDLITALKRKGIDTFRYESPEGTEIQRLKMR